MLGLETFENCSVSTCAYRCTFGISATISFTPFLLPYPPSVPGSRCSPAIVPPVAITRTFGRPRGPCACAGVQVCHTTTTSAIRADKMVRCFIGGHHRSPDADADDDQSRDPATCDGFGTTCSNVIASATAVLRPRRGRTECRWGERGLSLRGPRPRKDIMLRRETEQSVHPGSRPGTTFTQVADAPLASYTVWFRRRRGGGAQDGFAARRTR